MPSSPGYIRNYTQEKKTSDARGEGVKNKNRKQAKRNYEKAAGKCSGDVDHKDGNTNNNKKSNLRCVPASKNRSYPRTKSAGKKQS